MSIGYIAEPVDGHSANGFLIVICMSRPEPIVVQKSCRTCAKRVPPCRDPMDAHVALLHEHSKTACCNPE